MILIAVSLFFITGLFLSIYWFGNLLDFLTDNLNRGVKRGPWKTHLGVGRANTPLIEKAAIARIGLGANNSDETIYWNALTDNEGEFLFSSNNYSISFTVPPGVHYDRHGFWSITVYGADKYLVPNSYYKYVIRSDIPLEKDGNGHFSIFLSRQKPDYDINWLPLPERDERFSIALRCYIPVEAMKKNTPENILPSVIKL